MSVLAKIIEKAAQIAAGGSSAFLALSLGTAPDAANRIGLFADTTASAEQLVIVVGAQTGPAFLRSGSNVIATGMKLQDSTCQIVGSSDASKSLAFQVDTQGSGFQLTVDVGAQAANRTLSVPVLSGNRTLAVIDQAQSISGVQSFTDTTTASSSTTGAVVVGNGVAATSAAIGGGAGVFGGSLTSGALTSGRVPYVSTGGLLIDGFNLQYASDTLTSGSAGSAAASSVQALGAVGTRQQMIVHVAGVELAQFCINNSGASHLGIPTDCVGIASQNSYPIYFCVGSVAKAFFDATSFTLGDTINLVVGSTAGAKIATSATQKLGIWNATPIVQPSAYTQTFATTSRTVNSYTSDAESGAYTGLDNAQGGSPYAQLTDLNALRVAYETLRAMAENMQQVVNSLIDDHQAIGLCA